MSENNYTSRSDSVETKLRLLREAHAAQRYELAAALAESIRDTLKAERQLQADPGRPVVSADEVRPTTDLPAPWREWARGWSAYQVLRVEETVGLARDGEPVDVLVSVPAGPITRLAREARLARIDPETGVLHEVPSQIYDERRRGGALYGRLVFFASVPAHGRETFLLFSDNPDASLPNYLSDLRVHGEGFGLDVENTHFSASLSRQMGQLERLTYKGSHPIELFAKGDGHGEPPNIDWAHDYLASGHFQKFRVTNWDTCPNYEVVRGPLCVTVRRWGFPHGPIHPLFTPSRMFIDVTYTFYAHTPYFLKNGRMEMVQDFTLNYLRDDEWLFSGYPFTDALWLDENGHMHEGEPPEARQGDLWGVGFFHRDHRCGFMSLRLDHSAEGFPGKLHHAGPPVLHYEYGGQIWSRWAARDDPFFPSGAVLKQHNAYFTSPYPAEDGASRLEEAYRRLRQPLQVGAGDLPTATVSSSAGRLARVGEAGDSSISKQALWEALRECRDPMLYQIDANVVDFGYISDIQVQGSTVRVLMTMPHRGRPKYRYLGEPIRQRLLRLDGVEDVIVDLTWEPPWSANNLTRRGASELGLE